MSQGHFLFDAGHVIRTPLALLALVSTHVSEWSLLERHQSGDFGDIDTTMRASNAGSMKHGGVIFSSYQLSNGCALWIITETKWKMTTLLLPSEYPSRFPGRPVLAG